LTTTTHKVNTTTWKENIQHYQSKEVQYAATSRKNYADTFMGLKSINPGTLYTERGTTVNNVYYREMLWAWLRPASLMEYQGMVKKGVALLHDNFNLHTAIHTVHNFWPAELQGVGASST
jgi:hypothetical protein